MKYILALLMLVVTTSVAEAQTAPQESKWKKIGITGSLFSFDDFTAVRGTDTRKWAATGGSTTWYNTTQLRPWSIGASFGENYRVLLQQFERKEEVSVVDGAYFFSNLNKYRFTAVRAEKSMFRVVVKSTTQAYVNLFGGAAWNRGQEPLGTREGAYKCNPCLAGDLEVGKSRYESGPYIGLVVGAKYRLNDIELGIEYDVLSSHGHRGDIVATWWPGK